MEKKIIPDNVYTTEEASIYLKVSMSTMKRLLKARVLRANKVGRQYRILGKEILHLVSPELERKGIKSYLKIKGRAVNVINKW